LAKYLRKEDMKHDLMVEIKSAIQQIPPEVVNGGVRRARAYKKWAEKAIRALNNPRAATWHLQDLMFDLRRLCSNKFHR
jgi:hypothetical protein